MNLKRVINKNLKTMKPMIFINLPVNDLPAAMEFYTRIGFTNNPHFTDQTAAGMVYSDTISVMLLTREKFQSFTSKSIAVTRNQVQVLNALTLVSKEKVDGMKPFIPFTNIFRYDVISNEEYQYVKIRDTEKQNKVLKYDLLFLMSSETLQDIGKCSIYLGNEKELYLNSFCKGFRITCQNIDSKYVNALLLSNPYRNYFSVVGRGFTRINIKQEYVNILPILIPKVEEQNKIIEHVNNINSIIKSTISLKDKEIEKLKEYKSVLINEAVSGKIKVN